MMRKQSKQLLAVGVGMLMASAVPQLQAAGFYLKEQSIVSQGQAFSGVAAQSGIASATYFNPAGLATIDQTSVETGLHMILTNQEVNGSASNALLGNSNTSTQEPLDSLIAIPNLFWSMPVDDYVVGLGVNAPFGSKNSYDSDYFGRFDHVSADLKTVDYTVALSKQLTEQLRVGGSIYYQTLEVEQSKIAATAQQSTLKGDADDVGFSLGVQYVASPSTVVGLSHRSGTTQGVSGTNSIVGAGLIPENVYQATATMELPSITSLGIEHAVDQRNDLYLGITHYNWSVYDTLIVNTTGIGSSSTVNNYQDTTSYSVGLNHRYSDDLELRGGIHYDPTPTDDANRSHSTPDGDRTWLSFGGSKTVSNDLVVDFAYSYIHADDAMISKAVGAGATSHTVTSTTDTSHNIFSIGLRKTF